MSKFVVIEGPDNVGKTTISRNVSSVLNENGISSKSLSFPGNRKGTLGKFIHDFHHEHDKYGIKGISNTSLQLLHVAAHFDTISGDILPALNQETLVILDRYWWSTYVYGKVNGIDEDVLQKIMELEELAWGDLSPDLIFLISNEEPIDATKTEKWNMLRQEYMNLAKVQSEENKIICLENDDSIEQITQRIIGILDSKFEII